PHVEIIAAGVARLFDQLSLLAGLEFVWLNGDVLLAERLRRVPRSVWAEEVQPEHERLGNRPSPLEPVNRLLDGAHRASAFVSGSVQHGTISQELFPARLPELAIWIIVRREAKAWLLVEPNVSRPGIARSDQRVIPLAPHPDHVIKPAPIADPGL